jgi:H+-translocating NAD(P) transhydrogenase subunit beta
MTLLIDFTVIATLIIGIWQFREPLRAKHGNMTAALARVVSMIQVPAMVAFQHGAGGIAAFLVSLVELSRTTHALSLVNEISGVFGLAIGSLTFSGSMIASAKLANKMQQAPRVLTHHNLFVVLTIAALVVIGAFSLVVPVGVAPYFFICEIFLGICFGVLLAVRIGGADMPVLISSLNATAGLAASLCGMVIENQLLIAFGATVAASGSILTYVMCKAMNRKIGMIIFPDYKPQRPVPKTTISPVQPSKTEPAPADTAAVLAGAVTAMRGAEKMSSTPSTRLPAECPDI